jgi:membrane fusion protein (multidrug efflux system)
VGGNCRPEEERFLSDAAHDNNQSGIRPADEAPGGRGMLGNGRRRITLLILVLAVIAGAIYGGRWFAYTRTHANTDDAQVEADIYPVSPRIMGHVSRVVVATNQAVRAGQLLVEIDPRDYQVALAQAEAALAAAKGSATAAEGTVNVTEQTGAAGISQAAAQVAASRAGEVMSKRESESASDQVEAARADEAAAAAAVDVAQRGVAAAEAAITGARAKADEAQKNAARADQLLQQGAMSAQQRDAAVAASVSAQAAVEVAQAQAESARAALRQAQQRQRQAQVAVGQAIQRAQAARAQVAQAAAGVAQAEAALRSAQSTPIQTGVRKSEARGAQGRLAQAQAQLEQAKLNLSYTRIVAPVDGVVAKKNVQAGQFVQPGQSLMAVVATASIHVTANFKETQMRGIRPGQRATFSVDAYPGVRFTGHVASVSPGTGSVFSLLPPENASGNFTKVVQRIPVRIAVDRSSRGKPVLRDGMSAVVTVETK